jgi:hypothetical protein
VPSAIAETRQVNKPAMELGEYFIVDYVDCGV